MFQHLNAVHTQIMKRTLHVCKSVPDEIVLCELGWVPLHLFWQKLKLDYVARLTDLPGDRLVKKAFAHASSHQTFWSQRLVSSLAQHHFEGLLAEGAFSVSSAVKT